MFRLHLEWDYGQDNIVFTSKEKAIDWYNQHPNSYLMFEELLAEGLASIEELTVI